jgi:hypothetical protein
MRLGQGFEFLLVIGELLPGWLTKLIYTNQPVAAVFDLKSRGVFDHAPVMVIG